MFPERNIAIVANATRDAAKELAQQIALLLTGMNVSYRLFLDVWPTGFTGFTEVWLVGGDGTLNFFVNHYPGIVLPMALFKGGTGNDFHWMLYGDMDMEQQVECLLTSNDVTAVDAGQCNERLFLNNFGAGFDARITRDLLHRKKKPGKASYLVRVFKNILFYRSFSAHISTNTKGHSKYFMISISNGKRTGGGFYLAPLADLEDGVLEVHIISKLHPLRRLRYLPVLEKGRHANRSYPFLQYFQSRSLSFNTDDAVDAHVDGEYFSAKKFELRCLPKRFFFLTGGAPNGL
ncbi:MAG: diacylglycerol/lipid kinase family protein [Flavisolibacter sp.]